MSFSIPEIALAQSMRKDGAHWNAVARAINRRSADGIRRRLDFQYQQRRNEYHCENRRFHRERFLLRLQRSSAVRAA